MIKREQDKHTPVCDTCGAELQPAATREDAIQELINADWALRYKLPGGWRCRCPHCYDKEADK